MVNPKNVHKFSAGLDSYLASAGIEVHMYVHVYVCVFVSIYMYVSLWSARLSR